MIYLDNDEVGLARETSHPEFNKYFKDDFYFSCIDEFSPFGNDEGWDVLRRLEEFYRERGKDAFLLDFLDQYLMRVWGWNTYEVLPKIRETDIVKILEWGRSNDYILIVLPQIIIATALGQLKIIGIVDKWFFEIFEDTVQQRIKLLDTVMKYGTQDEDELLGFIGLGKRIERDNCYSREEKSKLKNMLEYLAKVEMRVDED